MLEQNFACYLIARKTINLAMRLHFRSLAARMFEAAQQESLENVKFNIHRTNVCAAAALDAFS